jgi:putative transposase
MNSPQTIDKQKGNQALSHHNTVFSQLLKLIPRHEFEALAKQHHTGRSFRTASRWSQFVTMAMAQLSGRSSLRDIIENISARSKGLEALFASTTGKPFGSPEFPGYPVEYMTKSQTPVVT